jgi:hypothetical protein
VRSGKHYYQTWLCFKYADLAFAVSSLGLGKIAIPNHIYKETDCLFSNPKVGGRANLAGFGSEINPASSS